jgi:predicted HD superfamily hydrolase involved in NAD metabolism
LECFEEFYQSGEKMFKKMRDLLTKNLSAKRLQHSIGVSETAASLAKLYGANPTQARMAGLLHDCAREIPKNILLQIAESFDIVVNDVERREPMLLHAVVGAVIAHRDYYMEDPEVLRAITWHTTGGPVMSLLDDIIFLADFIEPGRTFPGVDQVRMLAKTDLSSALLASYDQTIEHLIRKKSLIHHATVEGRNALLCRKGK